MWNLERLLQIERDSVIGHICKYAPSTSHSDLRLTKNLRRERFSAKLQPDCHGRGSVATEGSRSALRVTVLSLRARSFATLAQDDACTIPFSSSSAAARAWGYVRAPHTVELILKSFLGEGYGENPFLEKGFSPTKTLLDNTAKTSPPEYQVGMCVIKA